MAFVFKFKVRRKIEGDAIQTALTNYLDDFLFAALAIQVCTIMLKSFLQLCKELGVPVAIEKTEWPCTLIVFLGILLNGECHCLVIPEEKRLRALNELQCLSDKKKATIKQLQSLTGLLNFLCRAVHPGRAFVRRMYVKFSNEAKVVMGKNFEEPCQEVNMTEMQTFRSKAKILKPHHHVHLDKEFKDYCGVWIDFLTAGLGNSSISRPFVDLGVLLEADVLDWYTDAAKGPLLGFGGVCGSKWFYGQWEAQYIQKFDPSIEYLELFAVCVGIFTWGTSIAEQAHCSFL